MTNEGFGPVAGEDADGVTEGEDFFADSVEEGGGMATWKIGASSSLLIATMTLLSFIPARCWIAPEMPMAT